jgi:hypothetical protein
MRIIFKSADEIVTGRKFEVVEGWVDMDGL